MQTKIVPISSDIKVSFRKGSANPKDERYLYYVLNKNSCTKHGPITFYAIQSMLHFYNVTNSNSINEISSCIFSTYLH